MIDDWIDKRLTSLIVLVDLQVIEEEVGGRTDAIETDDRTIRTLRQLDGAVLPRGVEVLDVNELSLGEVVLGGIPVEEGDSTLCGVIDLRAILVLDGLGITPEIDVDGDLATILGEVKLRRDQTSVAVIIDILITIDLDATKGKPFLATQPPWLIGWMT